MSAESSLKPKGTEIIIEDPPIARFLFADTRFAWFWLILRLYIGYEWLTAGWGKVTSPDWVGAGAGTALTGFVTNALTLTTGAHPSVQPYYAWFLENLVLPNAAFWSYLVAFGEVAVGLGLILGMLTGIAAFFGGLMNVSYLMAGTVSTNPLLFVIATWLVLAWKTAGWWGVDRWLLPILGTPWHRGSAFDKEETQVRPS